jgi:hypothetical protein
MGLRPRQFDFPDGRVGGFGVHGSTGGATGAGFGLLYFDWRVLCKGGGYIYAVVLQTRVSSPSYSA